MIWLLIIYDLVREHTKTVGKTTQFLGGNRTFAPVGLAA